MPCDFSGKWTLDRTEGGAEFASKLGIPADKIPKTADLVVTQDGNNFNFKIITEANTREHKVVVGVPFKESILGMEIEGTANWEGDRLVTKTEKGSQTVREIVNGELVVSMTVQGATAKRVFKKC
ncbi:fatty acid-binding protein, intestinal-like [Amphiura filiformis]|uniref:fatty acid-binding protein, intestinal-like n=1 Tax=Amphiura filiformis TaxID=82378 RepID=UPI003B21AEC8